MRKDAHSKQVWDAGNVNDYIASDIDNWLRTTYVGLFSPYVQSLMGTTRFYVTGSGRNAAVGPIYRSAFLVSGTELGGSYSSLNVEGSILPTANIIGQVPQWTRSKDTQVDYYAYMCQGWAQIRGEHVTYDQEVCPCFTLPADTFIDSDLNLQES